MYEAKLYKILQGGGTLPFIIFIVGIPNVQWSGTEGEYNVLIIDLLGPSLEELFNCAKHKFSLKTILLLADQLVFQYLNSGSFNALNISIPSI